MKLPEPHYLTLEQIRESLAAQGYEVSCPTLRSWLNRGLLPRRVQVQGRGRGRGVVHLHSPMSVERAKRILEMRKQGFSGTRILRELTVADDE